MAPETDAELVTQCNRLKHQVSPGVQGRADLRRGGQKDPTPCQFGRLRRERQRFVVEGNGDRQVVQNTSRRRLVRRRYSNVCRHSWQ
jgi:hypothetical protein